MRFLLDENIPATVVRALREQGHDACSAALSMPGAADAALLAAASEQGRVLVTQDKDFGELAVRAGLPGDCGVVLFRLTGAEPGEDIRHMLDVLASDIEFHGHLVVVTSSHVRTRRLRSKRGREPS